MIDPISRNGTSADRPSDDELMRRIATGDAEAFRRLVRRHQDRVGSLIFRFAGSTSDAEDLAQEVFLRVYRAAPRYRPQQAFRTWLYRIVTNLCMTHRRRIRPLSLPDSADLPGHPIDSDAAEREEAVRRAIAKLPAQQRMAVVLRQYEAMSYDEIAGAMGVTAQAVDSLLVRARRSLREWLSRWIE